ncbi:nucleoside 2-deoxyribosyltransferase domain-containing protein [Dyella sp. C9]|uniref:nucleoside 2-deoxyribosyltransferase domain-containing protein n=1 Tax=Dyella sp. C9 TaxID=2202154 RepID=UPI000DEF577A|nr:nucleoside 2-deoxyribosyltransferase domain-containing protein [Dyella sp. C9]
MHRSLVSTLFGLALLAGASLAQAAPTVIVSPQPLPHDGRTKVFLAGSIDMGKAVDWQKQLIDALADTNVVILNPRRTDWNPAWKAELNDEHFAQQVNWELSALDQADVVVMYLAPGSHSPVSLMELGLHARSGKVIVLCPEGYWRKGNVDAVAARYQVEQADSMDDLLRRLRKRLQAAPGRRAPGA